MAQVEIITSLKEEVIKKFKGRAADIFRIMRSMEESPHKGKIVGYMTGILVKELKYGGFRFYFLVDGNKLTFYSEESLKNILIKFVRMSDKKSQQKVIEEIKHILRNIGETGF